MFSYNLYYVHYFGGTWAFKASQEISMHQTISIIPPIKTLIPYQLVSNAFEIQRLLALIEMWSKDHWTTKPTKNKKQIIDAFSQAFQQTGGGHPKITKKKKPKNPVYNPVNNSKNLLISYAIV